MVNNPHLTKEPLHVTTPPNTTSVTPAIATSSPGVVPKTLTLEVDGKVAEYPVGVDGGVTLPDGTWVCAKTGKVYDRYAWRPGKSANPGGRPKDGGPQRLRPWSRFLAALEALERDKKVDLFEHFVHRARKDDPTLRAVMDKLLPNRTQINIGPEDINGVMESVADILTEEIKDPELLGKIIGRLEKLELQEAVI